ncbi:MFS transporter [Arthrobacter cavernae]|uniref:MHS family MFS transporter n=1 Tax=Arthrobacter cavernae TaxID=2817681 RepID=A0A939KIX4_9MICC|nr:MFS transporter [Arthrobacter cavernae]MBO1268077.1 MHS family MFS transporter [Arthrobacter cavernae]
MTSVSPVSHASPHSRKTLRKVAFASAAGTTIEFYDFFIYGTAAALVFPVVFFPALGAAAGTVASFGTFAVAFFARPVGAIIFGHFGDRIGRKKTLITTLLMMGIATVAIGLVPDAKTIGVAAPILLVVLRFVQGLAVGGEWAGATLLTAEYAPKGKRGLFGSFPQIGPSIAFALASATFLVTNLTLGDKSEAFITIGWRVPFILSAVLVLVGFWVRSSIEETPVFKNTQQPVVRKLPILESIKRQPKEILLAGGSLTLLFAFFYLGTAFLTSYAASPTGMKLSRVDVLSTGIIASVFVAAATLTSGILSDRFGRKKVIATSCIIAVPWSLVLFPLLGTGTVLAFGVGLTVTLMIFAIAYGPAGALLPELFETRYRYTGAGMGYNLAGVVGGGIVPLLAAQLAASPGTWAVGLLLAGIGVFSIICTLALPNREHSDMEASAAVSGAESTTPVHATAS